MGSSCLAGGALGSCVVEEVQAWLRPYQLEFLADRAQFRIYLKARQIGISDVIALDSVLTASGLLSPDVVCHNVNVISRRDREARDLISKCQKWIRVLSQDPVLAPMLATRRQNSQEIVFVESGRYIRAETQSANAAVGASGHLVLDEFALQAFAREIWTGALPIISSTPGLRVTIISTPRPNTLFEEIWQDTDRFHFFSRHQTDIFQAAEQGHPIDIELMRSACATEEQWRQEYLCEFLSTGEQYFDRPLMMSAHLAKPVTGMLGRFAGIDIASIVDLTAIQACEDYGGGLWLTSSFVIGQGTPYESNPHKGVVGQDIICDAVLRYLGVHRCVCDATGEGAKLVGYLGARRSVPELVPHVQTREWKNEYVPAIRGAIERGFLHVDSFTYRLYSPRRAADFVVDGRIPDEALADFVSVCFPRREFSMLLNDFGRVHKTFTQQGMTFDTTRDKEGGGGHGDLFWGSAFSIYAWSLGRPSSILTPSAPTGIEVSGRDFSEFH